MSVRFSYLILLLVVYCCCQLADGKGGRGGGGGRSGGIRIGGSRSSRSGGFFSRSSSSRVFRFSSGRGYATRRYSYQWKSRAYSYHYIYVGGHYHSSNYRPSNNLDEWNVCFNLIFSGVNNTPIVQITSHEALREMDDSVYEVAVDRLLNLSLHFVNDNVSDILFPTEEANYTKPWQYMGFFACPMFPQQSGYKYCCGPDEFQYCCSYWESFSIQGIVWGTLFGIIVIGFLIFKGKPLFKRFKNHCKSRHGFEGVTTTEITNTSSKNPDNANDLETAENDLPFLQNNNGSLQLQMSNMQQDKNPTAPDDRPSARAIGFDLVGPEFSISLPYCTATSQPYDSPANSMPPPPPYEFAVQSKE